MSAINVLPSSSFWSLVKKENGFKLLSQTKAAWRLYPQRVENLLTGEKLDYSGITFLEDFLSRKKIQNLKEDELWVVHTFYEAGLWWNEDSKSIKEKVSHDQILGLIFDYQEQVDFDPSQLSDEPLAIDWKSPNPLCYEEAFNKGREFLMRGDCYQYNLTFPFYGKIQKGGLASIIQRLWRNSQNIGEFAGLTVCGENFYLTNTPECLFEWSFCCERKVGLLETRPIKGTTALKNNESTSFNEAWFKLSSSKKDESELFMITDLLRNDLNRIESPCAKVIAKKAPLVVPGLLHSYSHIQVELSGQVSLLGVMKALFPGGSITGAPKIRVMQIIDELEVAARGFYCGSTLYQKGDKLVGSINIRSAQGNHKTGELSYHAGGGITVKSTWESEYQEMENKFLSFQSLLTSR